MKPVVDPAVERYAAEHTTAEPPHLGEAAAHTEESTSAPEMMVGVVEGRFLEMLVHVAQPAQVLEIGTFTGYSALSMAAALPPGGRVVTLEIDPEHAALARRHVDASPYGDRVEIRLGPALETLAALDGPFGLVFIDADKGNYRNYYEAALPLLSGTGVIVVDNVLWSGRVVADPTSWDEDTRAIAAFNDHVRDDPRVIAVMLTVRDGVTLIRRR